MSEARSDVLPDVYCADVTAVVLAGGRGTRMGGGPKALRTVAGRPMLDWLLAALRPQVGSVLVNANEALEAHAAFGAQVVEDAVADHAGPLAGIHAGALRCATPWLLSLPCDAVRLPPDLVSRLRAAALAAGRPAAYAVVAGDGLYPLCLVRREVQASLAERLRGEDRSVRGWLASIDALAVDIDDWPGGRPNVNTPEALAAIEAELRSLSR
jgi:molybdopterin-guanine dinucleotide biosynthesis protein A